MLVAAVLYYAVLFVTQGFLPQGFNPPLYLLAIPLIVIVAVLASNLSNRATSPSKTKVEAPRRIQAREVQFLARQIDVGMMASPAYFDLVLLSRLREVLVEKVSLETGIEKERVRELLANPSLGPGLLREDSLYRLLYSPPPARGPTRVKLLEDAIALVEAWKL